MFGLEEGEFGTRIEKTA